MSTQKEWNYKFVSWLAVLSKRFVEEHLGKIDINKMRKDPVYAKKCFLYNWGYERANSPKGYKIAAVKTIAQIEKGKNFSNPLKVYRHFYPNPQRNQRRNPCMDNKLWKTDISHIIKDVEEGELRSAFELLNINGVGHKIRSLFIRDIIVLTNSEPKITKTVENYL